VTTQVQDLVAELRTSEDVDVLVFADWLEEHESMVAPYLGMFLAKFLHTLRGKVFNMTIHNDNMTKAPFYKRIEIDGLVIREIVANHMIATIAPNYPTSSVMVSQ
jgi:hypothetical protein